jgi:hypothetical protein
MKLNINSYLLSFVAKIVYAALLKATIADFGSGGCLAKAPSSAGLGPRPAPENGGHWQEGRRTDSLPSPDKPAALACSPATAKGAADG